MLAAFHLVHLAGLLLNGHVFVDDAHAALPGDGNAHAGVGDSVHGGGHQRDVQPDFLCQLYRQIDVLGQHLAFVRHQQDVVKGQPFADILS